MPKAHRRTAGHTLDWLEGCFDPACGRIAKTLADEPINAMTIEQIAARILSDLADINITVEFIDGPRSTGQEDYP